MNKMTLKYEKKQNVIYISDFIDFLNNKYEKKYTHQELVNISYSDSHCFRNIVSIYDNVDEVSFFNPGTNVEYLIKLKNDNKYSVLEGEVLEFPPVIIFKTLPENKELIILDSIELYNKENISNIFTINSQQQFNIDLTKEIIKDKETLDEIKKIVHFRPKAILNLFGYEYISNVLGKNQLKITILNNKDKLQDIDSSFDKKNSLNIMYYELLIISEYVLFRTSENNLVVLNNKKKKQQ